MDPWNAMKIIDVNGLEHGITCYHISMMMLAGWICFLLSSLLNIVYYAIHPSGVDFNKERFYRRFYFYFCASKIVICGSTDRHRNHDGQMKEHLAKRKATDSHVVDIENETFLN